MSVINGERETSNKGDDCLLPMDEALRRRKIEPTSFRARYANEDGTLSKLESLYQALHRALVHTNGSALDMISDNDIARTRRKIGPNSFEALQLGARERVGK